MRTQTPVAATAVLMPCYIRWHATILVELYLKLLLMIMKNLIICLSSENFSLIIIPYILGAASFASIKGLDLTVFETVTGNRNNETIKFQDSTVFLVN